jgi:hypothetical protein
MRFTAPIGFSAIVLALALTACASDDAPAPAAAAPAPPPPIAQSDAPSAGGGVAAPGVSIAPPAPAPPPGDVVVPSGRETPVSPNADQRTVAERAADIRAWDQCVSRAQAMGDSDPNRVQMDSPEDACSRSLGMSSRTAVPASRQTRSR